MSTALAERPPVNGRQSALATMADTYSIEPDKLMGVLRGTVIKPGRDGHQASNEEVAAFVIVANQYGLNPFTREIHAFSDPRRGLCPIVGIDGWARIVNREERFDGCEFEEHFDAAGKLTAMTCIMHVKGRGFPIRVTEWLSENQRDTDPWKKCPRRMLRHRSFIQAARLAFSLAGIMDEDEAEEFVRPQNPASVVTEIASKASRVAARIAANKPVALPTPAVVADSAPEPEDAPPFDTGEAFEGEPVQGDPESPSEPVSPSMIDFADLPTIAPGERVIVRAKAARVAAKSVHLSHGAKNPIPMDMVTRPDWLAAGVEVEAVVDCYGPEQFRIVELSKLG